MKTVEKKNEVFREVSGFFVIPARAGSKGLPDKNIRTVGGKTLIERACDAAKDSKLGFRTILSSDSEQYLVRHSAGAEILHKRAESVASDTAQAYDVMKDVDRTLLSVEGDDTTIVYLQPTSPLRTGLHISEAYRLHTQKGGEPVCSVIEGLTINRGKFMRPLKNGKLESVDSIDKSSNRQDLEVFLYPNGAIYIFSLGQHRRSKKFPIDNAWPYFMNKLSSIDIDDEHDLRLAELIANEN